MNITVNEKKYHIKDGSTAFQVRDLFKKDADIVIVNGFQTKEDVQLKEGDKITLIKRGEIPKEEEIQWLLTARHTPGVHEKVKKVKVGIAGLGGLGSNVAVSLARIGVGELVLVDYDVVEPSNLNRQHYFIKHIGMPKTKALKGIIKEINPFIKVVTKDVYIDESNVDNCFSDVDIIVEAFDDPKCKAVLVNTCLERFPDKVIIAASGLAGYFSNNKIKTKRIRDNFYLVGDSVSAAKIGCGLMAPRVGIAANHQANMVLRIILGERDV